MGETDRKQLTGDYYWHDEYSDGKWVVAALLTLFPPTMPLGAFIGGYMVVSCIETGE